MLWDLFIQFFDFGLVVVPDYVDVVEGTEILEQGYVQFLGRSLADFG
jgi:hypothetical protein